MQKIFMALAVSTLLFGCNFGSGPADPTEIQKEIATEPAPVVLNDDLFITLSAKILCLPSNHPEASKAEIEQFAKQILAEAGVNEADFGTYQQTVEADQASKKELSLAIVGKMPDFCKLIPVSQSAPTPEAEKPTENIEPSTEVQSSEKPVVQDSAGTISSEVSPAAPTENPAQ
ncbi:MAG: hypothetical protein V1936_03395 [Patescibacteria group bacterium]